MGRPRKVIEMQTGNITSISGAKRRAEEKSIVVGQNQLRSAPDWLIDDVARAEWKRIVKELKKIEAVGNLDRNNIAAYCNAYANYRRVTEELAGQSYTLTRSTRDGEIVVKNPLVDIQKMYSDEMRRFASLCGMTIDSRLKAAAVKTTKTEQEMESRFGNI
ncbi:MAG: phage terminase small subunit P27 family [Lachnospiraceae bacterium]|nr:phage terminase small subunit P27 family [Lachnospiraceae bacterium]